MEQKEKTWRIAKIETQIKKHKEQVRFNERVLEDIHTPGHVHYKDRSYLHQINRSNGIIRAMLPLLVEAYNELQGFDRMKYNLE